MVYKWVAASSTWKMIGEAVGRAAPRKPTTPDGKQWDHVTDVFVTDDRSVPLGFNRDGEFDYRYVLNQASLGA